MRSPTTCARDNKKAARSASQAAATTVLSPSATGIPWASLSMAMSPRIRWIQTSFTAEAEVRFRSFIGPLDKCRTSRRFHCAIAKYRTNRTEPLIFSPVDPHVLYFAANVLFKTTDGGNSWQIISPDLTRENPGVPASVGTLVPKGAEKQRGVIYALAPSFKTLSTLWAGTDDGQVWITRDSGKNWSNITPPELTAWSKVTQISASHFDEQTAYASVSRFRINDIHPYIYRTHDGGKTWKLIIAGLPDFGPVDTVREDRVRKGLLFAGTENAVWVSFDDGDHWQSLQLNLPHTSMRDLWIHDGDLIVATHGRAFWILDDITPLREASDAIANSGSPFRSRACLPYPARHLYRYAASARRACREQSSGRRDSRLLPSRRILDSLARNSRRAGQTRTAALRTPISPTSPRKNCKSS